MNEDELSRKRFLELSEKSYRANQFTFTRFLNMNEISILYEMERKLSSGFVLFGGNKEAERVVARFGDPEELGYEQPFPIVCIHIATLQKKPNETLGHRDYLGALMNLGIEREMLGDIYLSGADAYVMCLEQMAPYIVEQLGNVRHTYVKCEIMSEIPDVVVQEKIPATIQLASERIDGVVSKTFHLSRSESIQLFTQKKVFVNGRLCQNNSYHVKEKDLISVRGQGRVICDSISGMTKKGKLIMNVLLFGQR